MALLACGRQVARHLTFTRRSVAPRGTRRWINPWWDAPESRVSLWRRLTPPQLFVASFLALVLLGTLGFMILPGLYTGEPLGWTDAVFTAVSAVCINGLIVVDTATFFTTAGQAYVLLLIQLGGMGMITFTTVIILALGRRLSLRHEHMVTGGAVPLPNVRIEALTGNVVRFTLAIEAAGAILLYSVLAPTLGWGGAVWPAIFQAISAFCNAGFATYTDSLIGYQRSPAVLLIIMLLVVAGGMGFLTIAEAVLWRRAERTGQRFRLSLQSQLVLVTTGVLLAVGWVFFAAFEWSNTLSGLTRGQKLVNALFMSVTPRSGGFSTIDYGVATDSTNFLTILLMFVGGSPGSTAGGVKTTTLALLALLAWSRFRGREVTSAAGRTIPEETIQRAVGLALTTLAIVTLGIFAYTYTEHTGVHGGHERFLSIMFEATSAFNTVGLSMGVTPSLTTAGKWLTIVLMFVGRVGPLSFAAALALAVHRRRERFRYSYEDVVVG
jgi:trk system potassium uptake protein